MFLLKKKNFLCVVTRLWGTSRISLCFSIFSMFPMGIYGKWCFLFLWFFSPSSILVHICISMLVLVGMLARWTFAPFLPCRRHERARRCGACHAHANVTRAKFQIEKLSDNSRTTTTPWKKITSPESTHFAWHFMSTERYVHDASLLRKKSERVRRQHRSVPDPPIIL